TKYYGRLPALNNASFQVQSGEIVGFLGPNGAGKSTTMRILTCFTPATSGTARIMGLDTREDSLKIRSNVGYLPENVPLYDWMRVRGYLDFVARAKGLSSLERKSEIERVIEAASLESVVGVLIRNLSKGFRQRVGFAQALIGDPPILVLDEPTIGLDPIQIREVRELIKGLSQNRTVMLSTHILPEVSQVCDRVIIINAGSILAVDSPDNLIRKHTKSCRTQVTVKGPPEEVETTLAGIRGVTAVQQDELAPVQDGATTFQVEAGLDSDVRGEISRTLLEQRWELLELSARQLSLEDVFVELITEKRKEMSVRSDGDKEVVES
ncbi:ABC transporter ATP-binding protein, partial [Thermodesulfobacteriota bacterium]